MSSSTHGTVADVDALWDGAKLYIASVVPNSTSAANRAELRRYSYNAATDTYTLDSGFPAHHRQRPRHGDNRPGQRHERIAVGDLHAQQRSLGCANDHQRRHLGHPLHPARRTTLPT